MTNQGTNKRMKHWLQTIAACCKQLSLIEALLVLEPKGSVLSVRKNCQFYCLPLFLQTMWTLPCSVAQHHSRWVSPVIMGHQCLANHAITAYHLPCRAQLQQGLGDYWRLLVVGCHDRRIQSLHSPLAGVLQYCLPCLGMMQRPARSSNTIKFTA